ncbi:MAG TPA: LapA family protein [Vicinamibacteria bacterium]|nr:LapA family protein [Vicinamibacteria bacterium]
MKNKLRLALMLLLASTALVAALQNTEVVSLRFLVWEARVSQVALMLVTLGVGFLLGVLATLLIRRKS